MNNIETLDYVKTFCNLTAYDASVSGEKETISELNSLLNVYEENKLRFKGIDDVFFNKLKEVTSMGLNNIKESIKDKTSDVYYLIMEFENKL